MIDYQSWKNRFTIVGKKPTLGMTRALAFRTSHGFGLTERGVQEHV